MKGALVFLLCAGYALADIHSQCPTDFSIEMLLPHPECNKYYQCLHGHAFERTCLNGLYYNIETQLCDYEDNVDCSDRGGDTPSENGPKCDCPEDWSKELLFAHSDCDKYYHCYNGEAKEKHCQPGLYYEPEKQWCDWPDNVNCIREIVCPEPKDSEVSEPNEVNPECPTDWSIEKLLPHHNCNQFFKCYEGVAVPQKCPVGLNYNVEVERCDWPDNVDCSGRN